MKRTGGILLALLLSFMLAAVCYAATGEELLKSAEMYLTFEDSYADVNGKVEVQVDGDDPEFVEGRFGKAAGIRSGEGALYTEDLKFETHSFTVTTWVNVHEHDSDPCLFANKDWNSGANPGFRSGTATGSTTRTATAGPVRIRNIPTILPVSVRWKTSGIMSPWSSTVTRRPTASTSTAIR